MKTNVVCCFCAQSVNGEVPVEISARLEDGARQALWAHPTCLGARLHPEVPTLLPSTPAQEEQLSKEQAYRAMFAFLEQQWELSRSEELGALLGSMAQLPDGKPADPAVEGEWARSVALALQGAVRAELKLAKG